MPGFDDAYDNSLIRRSENFNKTVQESLHTAFEPLVGKTKEEAVKFIADIAKERYDYQVICDKQPQTPDFEPKLSNGYIVSYVKNHAIERYFISDDHIPPLTDMNAVHCYLEKIFPEGSQFARAYLKNGKVDGIEHNGNLYKVCEKLKVDIIDVSITRDGCKTYIKETIIIPCKQQLENEKSANLDTVFEKLSNSGD